MRIIYDTTTFHVKGTIPERVTAHIPPSFLGENTACIDIDYTQAQLEQKLPLAVYLEEHKNDLLTKVIHIGEGTDITFTDIPKPQQVKTMIVDLDNPVLDPSVKKYAERAKDAGATVKIDELPTAMLVRIFGKAGEEVGNIRLSKHGCCTWLYDTGEVYNRDYYPHYIGFYELITYLHRKAKYLDMGGFVNKDHELNRFKRKWGEEGYTTLA